MQEILSYILIIVFYSFTGYVTNLLAIRMLFRPYKSYSVFGLSLPFTPGLIPKERVKLSQRVGETVTHLLNPRIIMEELLEDSSLDRLYKLFSSVLDKNPVTIALPNIIREKLFEKVMVTFLDELPALLEQNDISYIVSRSFNTYSDKELEDMIVSVAKSELKAITWLGALLGAFLGLIQILMMRILSV